MYTMLVEKHKKLTKEHEILKNELNNSKEAYTELRGKSHTMLKKFKSMQEDHTSLIEQHTNLHVEHTSLNNVNDIFGKHKVNIKEAKIQVMKQHNNESPKFKIYTFFKKAPSK